MSPKEMWFLYGRNVKGTLLGGFLPLESTGVGIFWIFHIALLPLSLTLGAGIKTLFDIFTRKEQSPEQLAQLNDKITGLYNINIEPLIKELTSYEPKSISSKVLKTNLEAVSNQTISKLEAANKDKKWLLQIHQLKSAEHPYPLKDFTTEFISSVKLDVSHQQNLTSYIENNTATRNNLKLNLQKTLIKDYLSAEKNKGKRMQNIIHHHFFPLQNEEQKNDMVKTGNIISVSTMK